MLHDDGTVEWYGFGSSLSFLHRARRFFSFSKRERKEWVQKSVPLGAEETRRSGRTGSSAPTRCGGKSKVATMHYNCSQTLIRLLRRHLPRRGRQSAAAGIGRTGSSAPTGAVENRRNGRTGSSAPTGAVEDRRNGRTGASGPTRRWYFM